MCWFDSGEVSPGVVQVTVFHRDEAGWRCHPVSRSWGTSHLYAAAALLALLGWLVPNHIPPWKAFYHDLLAIGSLLVLCLAMLSDRSSSQAKIGITRPALFALLLALVPLAQFSADIISFSGDALMASSYLGIFALACSAGCVLDRRHGAGFLLRFAGVVLTGALVSTLLASHQWLDTGRFGIWLADVPAGGRPFANLGQPNNLATLFCIGLIASLYLYERGKIGRSLHSVIAFLLISGVAMTRSRTGLLSLLVIAAFILIARRSARLSVTNGIALSGAAISAITWMYWPSLSEHLFVHAPSSLERIESALHGDVRLTIWRQLLAAAVDKPLFGYGWNQVAVAQVSVAERYEAAAFTEHAHNLIVDLLVWNGLVIGPFIALLVVWWFVSRARSVTCAESWSAFAVVMVLGIHSLLEYPLEYAYLMIPAALCVGVVESRYPKARCIRASRISAAAIVVIGCALYATIVVDYFNVEKIHREMRMAAAGIGKTVEVVDDIRFLTQQREFIRFAQTPAREAMSEEQLEWMGNVAKRFAYPPVLLRYALALALNQRYDDATLTLKRLTRLHNEQRIEEARLAWAALVHLHPQLEKVGIDIR